MGTVVPAFTLMLQGIKAAIDAWNPAIISGVDTLKASVLSIIPTATQVQTTWNIMLMQMQLQITTYGTAIKTAWHTMLDYMQSQLNAYEPYLSYGLLLIGLSILGLEQPTIDVQTAWHEMLDYMQSQINAYQPYISYGITLLAISLAGLSDDVSTTQNDWATAWQNIYKAVKAATNPILEMINSIKAAYTSLMATLGQSVASSSPVMAPMGDNEWSYTPSTSSSATDNSQGRNTPIVGDILRFLDWVSTNPVSTWAANNQDMFVPGLGPVNGAAGAMETMLGKLAQWAPKGAAEAVLKSRMQSVIEELLRRRSLERGDRTRDALDNVSGFATGGIIGADQIVRVGEGNKREAIIPLESGAMNPFADAVADRIGGGMGGGSGSNNVYIMTVDNQGLKDLERKLKLIRIGETQRGLNA
jgi:hypothetical protein